jgi:CubicO group peptidase (beta-lactamase class C family)
MNLTPHHVELEGRLSSILSAYASRPDTNAVSFALASPGRDWDWEWAEPDARRQYFIASTTKLFVTAIIMQLTAEGALDLDLPAITYLKPAIMAGIHVLRGVDSSPRITVRELLSHTSGIADYFEQRRADGGTTFQRALEADFGWLFDDVLRITKEQMTPRFAPSSRGKAFYSDTNYQILGALIEGLTGASFEEAVRKRVIEPLMLTDTYPFTIETLDRYAEVSSMLFGTERIFIPKAMASVRADGGMVSTASDALVFLRAFVSGGLFPATYLEELQAEWRHIFTPLEYGTGIMRFALPRYFSPFRAAPAMIGHSGASGTVLFYVPEIDLYISGTVNQVKKRSLPYNILVRLVFACQDAWRSKH